MTESKDIALLCTLYPASAEKQEKVGIVPITLYPKTMAEKNIQILNLLRHSARNYYPLPSSLCTTWSYFTPINPPPSSSPVVAGLEVYTDKVGHHFSCPISHIDCEHHLCFYHVADLHQVRPPSPGR